MLPFSHDIEHGMARHYARQREIERGLFRASLSWDRPRSRKVARPTVVQWFLRWLDREGERCIELGPACELQYN